MAAAADSLPDFTGCVIDGHFELVQMLGSGGYGVVYKAIDTLVHPYAPTRYRAIKIVSKAGRSPSEWASIRREVALHSLVGHYPGVVGIYESFEDEEYFYIVLDFIPGGDLFTQILERHAYEGNDELIRKAFLSLVDAVLACHSVGIAHRDLKPENVLTSRDGSEIYLADFGMATNHMVVDKHGGGTGIYMSPECVGEMYGYQPYDPFLSDIWSLGVVLVNMITGRIAWSKPTLSDPSFAMFLDDPDFLIEHLPISDGAHAILLQMFDLVPYHRISLLELRRAISELDTFSRHERKAGHDRCGYERKQQPGMAVGIVSMPCEARPVYDYETVAEGGWLWSKNNMASRIDIRVGPRRGARSGGDCSAGSAFDPSTPSHATNTTTTTTTMTTTTTSTSDAAIASSYSYGSAWTSDSDGGDVITPETTDWRGVGTEGRKMDVGDVDWQQWRMGQYVMWGRMAGGRTS